MEVSSKRPHIQRVSPQDYEALYPERLGQSEVDDQGVHSLLVRTNGEKYKAYRLTVNIAEIKRQLSGAAFKTILLDADLRPATRRFNSLLNEENNWSSPTLRLIDNGIKTPINSGFFVPPQTDDSDLFLLQMTALAVDNFASA